MSGVKKIYTSENQYLYDTARENNLFRKEDYLLNKNAGTELEYLSAMIDTKDNISSSFDKALYDRLSGTDRFNYFVVENYSDHSSDEYKANVEYFKQKEQKIKQQEIYDGLTGLQKFGNTVGGLFDNALLQVHGLIENLIDAVPAAVGQIAGALGAEDVFESTKKFVAKDTTGYSAAQKEMNDWLSAYTILDKNWFGETLNNLTVAITRQLPTILGGAALTLIGGPAGAALSAVGTGIHYGAMYGASAEESYIDNADIDAWSALKYSAGTVGLEAVTEWGSNILFGASWFDPATGVAGKTVSSFGKDIWHDMWTEAVEESVSELFGSMLYKKYVDPTADTASITDILYAALLGAASGGLLSAAGGIAGTTKKSVYQGQIVDTSSLTTEQKKQAHNLGFLKSYKLSKLSQLASESLSQTTEVTKLQAKYTNLSLDQIKQQFPDQYADAVEQDATTTEIQTKQVLALAQFLSTIGEDSFRNAINVLNNNATAAREMVDNYLNRTDLYNKAAVVAFNTAFPDESYTPIKQPDNAEQELAKTVRMAFPNINVSFGVLGQKDGLAVKSVKSSGNWLFIESGLVSKNGYDYVLGQCIRQELANDVLTQLSELEPYLVDGLVSLITDEKTKYKDLPEEQKKTLAQLLCFDPVTNKRAFLNNKKLHSKIFKSITNQAEYVRRFGRQTEANKLRYHDMLVIRDTFLKSVAETIFNDTDVATVKNEYDLIDEELTTKITDKTVRTFLNENIRLTNVNFAKQAILRTDATQEIMVNRLDEQGYVNFDWSRLYDKTYYKPEFITTVTTTEQSNDFAESLRKYLLVKYNTQFDLTAKDAILKFITDKTNNTDVTKLANTLFTNEFVQSVNKTVLQEELAETLYRLSQTENVDQNADSIVITDNQIKGTGALADFHIRYFKGDVYERFNILGAKQDGTNSENTGKELQRTISETRTYKTEQISYLQVAVQEETSTSLEKYQKDIIRATKKAYGMNVKFFKNSPIDLSTSYPLDDVKGFIVVSKNTIYVRDDASVTEDVIVKVIRHEIVHHLLNKIKKLDSTQYTNLITKAKNTVGDEYWNELKETIKNSYKRETSDTIDEEVLVSILNDEIYIDERVDIASLETLQNSVFENAEYNNPLVTKPRMSVSDVDDLNRKLTELQKNYFKKSVVRDLMGRLLTMYHGTSNGGFTIYDIDIVMYGLFGKGFYHTENPDIGRRYSKIRRGDKQQVYEVYMNITHPIDMDAEGVLADWLKAVPDAEEYFPKTGTNEDFFRALEDYMAQEEMTRDDAADFVITTLTEMGYDGITHVGGKRVNINDPNHRVYIAFYPEQIKSVYNTNPTDNPDIRFSKDNTPTKTNITDKDLEQLGSTSYKTGETRKSKTKGFEDVEYEVSYVMDYEKNNRKILNKIKTLNDLRQVVNAIKEGKITGVEATHLLNLLQAEVIPFNFYGNESAMQLIKDLLSQRTTETAQELASRSELFAETHPVENLVNELTEKFGEKINVPEDVVVKWVPYYADRKNYLKQIKDEYQELQDKRDNTDDPYLKQQYTIKLKDLRTLAKMVVDENTAGVLDYYMSELKNSDTDKVENNEKIQDITKDLVTALVQHTDMSSLKPKYDPTKKSILKPEHAQKLANFWETVNGFRYLALLSSPATWGRNAITNTLISVNAIVEDALSGMIEKTRLLRAESQASYTGDYDQEFSDFIDEEFAPEVEKDTSGDKYNTTELEAIKREYAIENDPMKKHEILYKIKEFEQKMLNDKPWTKRRVLRNLKNTLAGSINMISNNVYGELKALYHGDNAAEILANMRKTNSPLADLFEQVFITNNNDDMIGVIKLAKQLPSSSQVVQEIYDNALYRGNKLLFKTENFLTKRISSLKKSHPAVAGFLSLFIPFARTSWNTSAYIVNHSPVGLIKGIIKGLQTRNMYIGDMRQEITNHYKNEYIKQNKKPNANFEFSQKKFDEWLSNNVSGDIVAAINGDTKSIKAVFDTMAEQGLVNSSLIGSNDIFARANTIESISQGLTGTAMLALGLILGALCEGFKIDEDDYLGPVLTVGNVRIKLSDLSPYATMFSVGAIVNSSDSVLDAFGNFASIMVDASMLNVIESAIQYSDGVVDYLGNQSINIVQQFIPAIFKSVTKTIDNAKKDKSGNYFERLYKTTFANTPLFSYLVANKIDPYTGETEKIYQSGFLEALWHNVSPIGTRTVVMSDMEREARSLGVGTTGLTGRFTINEVDYTVKNKEKYAKYRAEYIEKQFTDIFNNKQKVTVEDSNGKRITTTYDKLTDEQKKNVIERLYTEASAMTKIKWWIDAGNKYVVTDRDTYTKYRTLFDSANIVYKTTWTKSKFVEA